MKTLGDTIHKTPESACPSCGKLLDATSGADHDEEPEPGDYSVCIYCAATLRFGDDLALVSVSIDDVHPSARKQLADAAQTVKRLHARRMDGPCPRGFFCHHEPKCPGCV